MKINLRKIQMILFRSIETYLDITSSCDSTSCAFIKVHNLAHITFNSSLDSCFGCWLLESSRIFTGYFWWDLFIISSIKSKFHNWLSLNTAPPSRKEGNNTRCISCKGAALYINLIQAPHWLRQSLIVLKSKEAEFFQNQNLTVRSCDLLQS